ncbi:uncharacterized protein E0L32_004257 [Thyridium curvatum]|uniref:Glycine-rich cell wall structural protein 1 n=1 Tax=Thyridium curvatum TaxID=1093900 RepID=A0A507BE49_9PEZI|nr:uncharacterized protein E0L32_004257 [Thyridium curvatum]TPX15559.1 hypothetical protein E0L32_004257 [Thyridium curvatum]
MEAINSLANTASKAIWGEPNQEEPVSGVKGDTSKGEPFDAGNKGEEQDALNSGSTNTTATATTTTTTHNNSTAGTGTGTGGPTETKDSSVTAGDSTKAQNDVRDPSNPQTDEAKAEAKKDVDNDTKSAGGGLPGKDEIKGPGPKPLDQVAKQHGGDAGKASSGEDVSKTEGAGQQKAQEEEDDDGPQKVSHGEGTGEKYVKSSGLKADGGDFDAANPGAGREADRLLEEKGVHTGGDNHVGAGGLNNNADGSSSKDKSGAGGRDSSPKETKEKRSLSEKIKAKLHKN